MASDKQPYNSGGYNIKVRRVENGFTIHYTELSEGGKESHKNLIAWDEEMVLMESLKLHRDWAERNVEPTGAGGESTE